ncbi:MAG: hypothetical protein M1838_003477 [Thelocarpon superellum]|nr:MAG: hypothetical protein M1838_003477 [Thelocarpon superellum]
MRSLSSLFVAWSASCTLVRAAPWLATNYYGVITSTFAPGFTNGLVTESPILDTDTVSITPTATPLPTPLSTSTSIDSFESVTEVNLYFGAGAGTAVSETIDFSLLVTDYYVNLTYTAPSSCTDKWTLTTAAQVFVPGEAANAVTATATSTSVGSVLNAMTVINAFVNPTALPSDVLSSISSQNSYLGIYPCTPPNYIATGTGSPGSVETSSGSSDSSGSLGISDLATYCSLAYLNGRASLTSGCSGFPAWAVAVIVILVWFVIFLIAGLLESWVVFSSLMKGHKARRGLPFAFAGLFPPPSLVLLVLCRSGFEARSPADQQVLLKQWAQTPPSKRLGLWLAWGFRLRYPPILGTPPAWAGRGAPPGAVSPATGPPAAAAAPMATQQYGVAPSDGMWKGVGAAGEGDGGDEKVEPLVTNAPMGSSPETPPDAVSPGPRASVTPPASTEPAPDAAPSSRITDLTSEPSMNVASHSYSPPGELPSSAEPTRQELRQ